MKSSELETVKWFCDKDPLNCNRVDLKELQLANLPPIFSNLMDRAKNLLIMKIKITHCTKETPLIIKDRAIILHQKITNSVDLSLTNLVTPKIMTDFQTLTKESIVYLLRLEVNSIVKDRRWQTLHKSIKISRLWGKTTWPQNRRLSWPKWGIIWKLVLSKSKQDRLMVVIQAALEAISLLRASSVIKIICKPRLITLSKMTTWGLQRTRGKIIRTRNSCKREVAKRVTFQVEAMKLFNSRIRPQKTCTMAFLLQTTLKTLTPPNNKTREARKD